MSMQHTRAKLFIRKLLYVVLVIWCLCYLLNAGYQMGTEQPKLCDPHVLNIENIEQYFDALYRCHIYD
ncbi:MAG: hypothetical protein ACRC53_03255 [Plesiomonas sp.]|uniref:hypothetical protein n=1 Tax=Plesiomonas sp. TaxID=2486279 RepID=UPI003F340992